ncbi:hypothetical protein GCM10010216_53420 [Streptomyces flaveolus]|nr:hypothetical protein GCM10010216_53420 [Streptomyces flaveolus]
MVILSFTGALWHFGPSLSDVRHEPSGETPSHGVRLCEVEAMARSEQSGTKAEQCARVHTRVRERPFRVYGSVSCA